MHTFLLILCFATIGALGKCDDGSDPNSFSKITLKAPSFFGAFWNYNPKFQVYSSKQCPAGQTVFIKKFHVYTPVKGSFFSWFRRDHIAVETWNGYATNPGRVKVKKASSGLEGGCFKATDIATGHQMISWVFKCRNSRDDCTNIHYKFEVECRASSGRRLTETPSEQSEWDYQKCPLYTQVESDCRARNNNQSCTDRSNITDAEFNSVCNEYKTNAACLASTKPIYNISENYEFWCNTTSAPVFNAASCPELVKVNATCQSTFGSECAVEKVSKKDVASVCSEWRTLAACKDEVAKHSMYLNAYEKYCPTIAGASSIKLGFASLAVVLVAMLMQ